ncbi:MAG: TraR/DksA C4-type zinc finger protein [Acidimicrobiales bacterium]
MDAGTYGLCESCSVEIPLERLQAIPHARLCVACSSRRSGVLR